MSSIADPVYQLFGDQRAPDQSLVRDNFARWFGKSMVTGKNGLPLTVHHGTHAQFDQFNMGCALDGAHFFTEDEDHACSFGPVKSYYLKLENPMEIHQDDLEFEWDKVHPSGEQDERNLLPRNFVEIFVQRAKEDGHDGLVIREMGDRDIQTDMWLPFTPQQIKATDNSGLFDPESPKFADELPTQVDVDTHEVRERVRMVV